MSLLSNLIESFRKRRERQDFVSPIPQKQIIQQPTKRFLPNTRATLGSMAGNVRQGASNVYRGASRLNQQSRQQALRQARERVFPQPESFASSFIRKTPSVRRKIESVPIAGKLAASFMVDQPELISARKKLRYGGQLTPQEKKAGRMSMIYGVADVATGLRAKGKFKVKPPAKPKAGLGEIKKPFYHATTKQITEFKETGKPLYLSQDSKFGKRYLGEKVVNVPVDVNLKKTAILDNKKLESMLKDSYFADQARYKNVQEVIDDFNMSDSDLRNYVFDELKGQGFDSAIIKKDWDAGFGFMESTVVFDLKKVNVSQQPTLPAKPVEIKPKVVSVPREQIPVGEGAEKVSRLEARVKNTLDNITPEQIDKLGLSTFKAMNNKEIIRRASEYVIKNPDEALKVLSGEIQPPKGLNTNSIYVAMVNNSTGNLELATKLATIKSTALGQNIEILKEIDPNSPVKIMSDIVKIREKAFVKRYKGRTPSKVRKTTVKDIKSKVKAPDKWDWSSFLKTIEC